MTANAGGSWIPAVSPGAICLIVKTWRHSSLRSSAAALIQKDLDLNGFDYDTDRERFTFHADSIDFTYNLDGNELMRGNSLEPDDSEPREPILLIAHGLLLPGNTTCM